MKATNLSALAKKYDVSYSTFIKWTKQVPLLELTKGQRILTPKQISILFEYFGNPEKE